MADRRHDGAGSDRVLPDRRQAPTTEEDVLYQKRVARRGLRSNRPARTELAVEPRQPGQRTDIAADHLRNGDEERGSAIYLALDSRLLPLRVRPTLAEADQAQEDPLGDALLRRREVMQRGIGAPGIEAPP